MKRRFTEEQIIGILREQEAGGAVKEITRRHGISEQSFYRWKAKYGGMEVSGGPAFAGARGGEREAQAASGRGASGQRGAEGRARPKVVRPAGKRAVVAHLVQAHGLSERRACRLADFNLSTWQYRPRTQERPILRERLKELASQRRRFGYRRLHACFAARAGGSITRRCTGSMSRRACRCAGARGSGWPGSSASPCWCHRRRTSAGPWTSSTISWPQVSACGR